MKRFPTRDLEEPATKEFVRAEIDALEITMRDVVISQTHWTVATILGSAVAIITTFAAAVGVLT